MALSLYAHPFSSYCKKVLVALYENDTPFTLRLMEFGNREIGAEFATLWPLQRMPVLVDDGRVLRETSVIIDYLNQSHPGAVRLIPENPDDALEARFMDRVFDNYVMTPVQKIVFNEIRPPEDRDAFGVTEARGLLDTAYAWLDGVMATREWACGSTFSMGDCAAASSLFYADWVHPIGDEFENLRRYRNRLLARPSFARAVNEARPYRHLFPLGAPDRD